MLPKLPKVNMRISTYLAGVLLLLLVCAGCAGGRPQFAATEPAPGALAGATGAFDRSASGATDYRLRLADPGPF
jgi:hypothetical protein